MAPEVIACDQDPSATYDYRVNMILCGYTVDISCFLRVINGLLVLLQLR